MEQKRTVILRGTESFTHGELNNVAIENGAIQLDSSAGRYALYGSYTSPQILFPAFDRLDLSWNADTPSGTVVELQYRVLAAGNWSGWKSMGRWSPDYPRACPKLEFRLDEPQLLTGSDGTVLVGAAGGGSGVQLRMSLYSDDDKLTPMVRLLAAAVHPLDFQESEGREINRKLYLPAYDIGSHDSRFGEDTALAMVLTALLNRFGCDLLPEELIYCMADERAGTCRNAVYATAAAGVTGALCYQAWLSWGEVHEELRKNRSLGVEMLDEDGTPHWMALHGMTDDVLNGRLALLRDPRLPYKTTGFSLIPEQFRKRFTGRAIIAAPCPQGVWGSRPLRRACTFKADDEPGYRKILCNGEPVTLPEPFRGWAAASPLSEQPCATTAERSFIPIRVQGSRVQLPEEVLAIGGRCTLYIVDRNGTMLTGEVRLPKPKPAPIPEKEPQNQEEH